jgi:hypothetical protein
VPQCQLEAWICRARNVFSILKLTWYKSSESCVKFALVMATMLYPRLSKILQCRNAQSDIKPVHSNHPHAKTIQATRHIHATHSFVASQIQP